MARDVSTPMVTAITGNNYAPIIMLDLTLSIGTIYVWSGVGTFVYNGHSYQGVGSLGALGEVTEGTQIKADGTTITLSGIDSTLLTETLNDIQLGAPVTIWFACFAAGGVVGTPYPLFVGTVDKPVVDIGPTTFSITLNLENRLFDLQRATNRRYTTSDQRYYYPDDIGFSWVEALNDIALVWGNS